MLLPCHISILDDDAAFLTGADAGGDRLQPFRLQPLPELPQGVQVHLLQLVQEHKTAFRVQFPDDRRRHLQPIRAGHVVPLLPLIDQLPVCHGKLRERQGGILQKVRFLPAGLLQLLRQLIILALVFPGVVLCLVLVQVGAHLPVGLFDARDTGLQLRGGFILQVFRRFPRNLKVILYFLLSLQEGGQLLIDPLALLLQLVELRPFPLILPVPCQDVLLTPDQLRGGYDILRGIREVGLLFRELLFLVSDLPDGTPPVILFCFLLLDRKSVV